MFCSHDWEIKDKTVMPSAFEQLLKGSQGLESTASLQNTKAVFKKTYICVMACRRCGAINKTIVSNP